MAVATLQMQSTLSAGLPQPPHGAWASLAAARLSCSPGLSQPLAWSARVPAWAGRRGLRCCSPWGREEPRAGSRVCLGQLWLLRAWPTQQGWRERWGAGPCSSGGPCSFLWASRPLTPHGTNSQGLWGPYLSHSAQRHVRLRIVSTGHSSAILRSSASRACRPDAALMCSRLLWMQLMTTGTWRAHQ